MTFIDPRTHAFLTAYAETFMRDYVPGIFEQTRRHGRTTRIIDMQERRLNGVHLEYEGRVNPNRGTVMTTDLHASMPKHQPGRYGRFVLKFDETDSSSNDFNALMTAMTVTFWGMKKDSDSNWKDNAESFLARDAQDVVDDVRENFARSIHLPSSGVLGTIASGGKKDDDSFSFDDASTYTAGSTTAMLLMEHTSMALLPVGQPIEIRQENGTLRVNNLVINRVEPHERTISVALTDESVDNAGNTVENLNAVAATDEVFINDSYNANASGNLANFFDESATYYRDASGTANDRTDADKKWLMPRIVNAAAGAGSSTVDLNENHIRQVGEIMGHEEGDGNAEVDVFAIMARDGYRQLTKLGKDETTKFIPALESEVGRRLNKAYGFNGYVWHDPNLGTVGAVVDDFAQYGNIDFLRRSDWETAVPISGGYQLVPNDSGGMWHNVKDSNGNPTLKYSARGVMSYAFVCTQPSRQCRVKNLNKAAV